MSKYQVAIISQPGVSCVSVFNEKENYSDLDIKVASLGAELSKVYNDKSYKRFSILNAIKKRHDEKIEKGLE